MRFELLTMIVGFAGGAAVLASFAAVAFGRLTSDSSTYHLMNLGGAAAMVAAGLPAGAWPSVAVNVVWAAISAHGLVRADVRPGAARAGDTVPQRL